MRIEKLMTTPVITCRSDETLAEAARKMWDHDCGAMPVVNDEGTLVGMLTDRDICMGGMTQCLPLSEIPIHLAMSRAVFAASPETESGELEDLMRSRQIRRVPIVDQANKPIGIVAIGDLIRGSVRVGSPMSGEGSRVLQALAAISEHRAG